MDAYVDLRRSWRTRPRRAQQTRARAGLVATVTVSYCLIVGSIRMLKTAVGRDDGSAGGGAGGNATDTSTGGGSAGGAPSSVGGGYRR